MLPANLQRSRGHRLLEVHAQRRRTRRIRKTRARRARNRSHEKLRTEAEETRTYLRARSRHTQPLHAGRNDRQQLLPRSRTYGWQDRRQHRNPRCPCSTTEPVHARRPHQLPELAAIITEGGRRGEIYAGLKRLRDTYADLIRQRFPDIPRRVSGYNLDQLLPENGFNVPRALVGSEGTCVTILEAECL